jgi:hypothetical protein
MSLDLETIYSLLPAIYRVRDAAVAESLDDLLAPDEQADLQALRAALAAGEGLNELQQRDLARLEEKRLRGPLKALLTIIAEQVAAIEENIEQLYDDQFIETCADWVVPYIADLIGYRALDPRLQQRLGSTRTEVANTIGFRRRKGTAAVLEELALDITDWDAAAVEFFLRLATTQYLNHLRLDHFGTPNLRRVDQLEAIGTPFDRLAHTADVRRIASRRGRYNIPNLGIFLWRVGSHQLTDSPAFRVDDRRYLFNPLGANTQLYHAAERVGDVTRLAEPLNVPLPITRRALRSDLARALRGDPTQLYGPGLSLTIQVGNQVLRPDQIEACDLSDTGPDPQTSPWAHQGQDKVAVDPVLGRIFLKEGTTEPVLVSYYYGFTANIGGGEYDRSENAGVAPEPVLRVPADWPSITLALQELKGQGTVEIKGSGRYSETPTIQVAANQRLEVRAGDGSRPLLQLNGDLVIGGGDSGEVTLNGLLIVGGLLRVPLEVNEQPNRLQKLRLVHCTLVPGGKLSRAGQPGPMTVSIVVEVPNVTVEIERCIVGGLRIVDESSAVIADSIIDSLRPQNVAYADLEGKAVGGALRLESCTLIGKVHTALLTASNCIFHAMLESGDAWPTPVIAERRQAGYVRYCYVPLAAEIPPRYACQPQRVEQVHQIVPRFTSLRYGDPGYCQLHAACPCVIRRGAADEGEMGAFHDLYAPQREDGLMARLDEYLPFGLETGLLFAS